MDHVIRTLACMATSWVVLFTAAPAIANIEMSETVRNCARQVGISTGFYVKTLTVGREQSLYVPPGGNVNATQSEQINDCIFRDIAARTGLSTAPPAPNPPKLVDICRAEYSQKLRLSRRGLDYKSGNVGARLLGRLFGRAHGAQLLNEEYDRCLKQVAYGRNKCRGSVLVGGSGYCIRRPYR